MTFDPTRVRTWDQIGADRLADEVAVLVRRGVIDSRAPAADALLDYRNPPSTPRADRLAAIEENVFRMGQPWSLLDVLAKLADAVEHLLTGHDCDDHGHEERRRAQIEARIIVEALVATYRR